MNTIEDQKILKGIAEGDEVVITTFYKKNMPYIRRYIVKNSGAEVDVEDVFQDALVFLYQKIKEGSIELHSSLSTYFYGVCKNIWRNRLRKNMKMVVTEDVLDETEVIDPEVIREITKKEQEHVYRKHFLNLTDTCKQVLNLLFQGNSMKEIADQTGYSEGYTRKKKFECKQHLLEMIEKDPMYRELKETIEKK